MAEAAAIFSANSNLIIPKVKYPNLTLAAAELKFPKHISEDKEISVVGIGDGTPYGITLEAQKAIASANIIIGYKKYCEQISWLTNGKKVIKSDMGKEIERCTKALKFTEAGNKVAIVCSGDSAIYGMASLVIELKHTLKIKDVNLHIIPGLTAAIKAAAKIGAPLTNDFAVISLSDLLTPKKIILRRLKAIAEANMVCALYNPRSHSRIELLDKAVQIFLEKYGGKTKAAFVKNAGEPDEELWVGLLKDMPKERIDMRTTVIVGNRETKIIDGLLITPRGYKL